MLTVVLAALIVAACDRDGEKYPLPATDATALLAGLADNPAVSPLPQPLNQVTTRFDAATDGRSVHWAFIGNEGQDLGRIVATVEPSGDRASTVALEYRPGTAPGGRWMTDQVRDQIEAHMPRLLTEAVDSALERRPFDMAIRDQVEEAIRAGLIGTMFQGIHSEMRKSIEEHEAKSKVWDGERKERKDRSMPPRDLPPPAHATKPTTDLSRFAN